MVLSTDIRPEEFPADYKIVLVVKKVSKGQVYAEVWANRVLSVGSLSRKNADVLPMKDFYGTLTIPEEAFDCAVHHICFDEVKITSMGNISAPLASIFRKIRVRFQKA